jgi:hypothetical protein
MMMGLGTLILAAAFCLLGTVVLVALAFAGFRYFVETGRHDDDGTPVGSLHGPETERIGR